MLSIFIKEQISRNTQSKEYRKYWRDASAMFTPEEVIMDNFYLEYIMVFDSVTSRQANLKSA